MADIIPKMTMLEMLRFGVYGVDLIEGSVEMRGFPRDISHRIWSASSPSRLPPRHPGDRSYSRFLKTSLTALPREVTYDQIDDH